MKSILVPSLVMPTQEASLVAQVKIPRCAREDKKEADQN
jgi:hypothetical protein